MNKHMLAQGESGIGADSLFSLALGVILVGAAYLVLKPRPPIIEVKTLAATDLSGTSAKLNGNLKSMGSYATVMVFFEHGETVSYGQETTAKELSATGAFNETLTNLAYGKTYHYRAVAYSPSKPDEKSYGVDQMFTLSQNAPVAAFTFLVERLKVSFTDWSTGLRPLTYEWEFGDGASSTERDPVHIYNTGKWYSVKLTVRNSYGENSISKDLFAISGDPVLETVQAVPGVDTAVLYGHLSALGDNSLVYLGFQYGTTTNYGTTIRAIPETLGTSGGFARNIADLLPNTTYHFRAMAGTASMWTSYGDDMTFTTEVGYPAPTMGTVGATPAPTSAMLEGALIDLRGSPFVHCYFEWGLTTSYGDITIGPGGLSVAQNFLWLLDGLEAGTTYHFRAVGVALGGAVGYGPDKSFTTTIEVPIPPEVTTLPAQNVDRSSATLMGRLDSKGNSGWVTVFLVFGPNSGPPYDFFINAGAYSVGGVTIGRTASGLIPNTRYYFRIEALGDNNTGDLGEEESFTTLPY